MEVKKMESILNAMDAMTEQEQERYADMMTQFATAWGSGYNAGYRAGLERAGSAQAEKKEA